jgi:hypothetical protein
MHVKPVAHVTLAQLFSHLPSTHTLFGSPQSLSCAQPFAGDVHTPPMQTSVPLQSVVVLHGQGPFAPPHVWHLPPTHAWPLPQSEPLVHCGAASG